jgi:hypothetical protein
MLMYAPCANSDTAMIAAAVCMPTYKGKTRAACSSPCKVENMVLFDENAQPNCRAASADNALANQLGIRL